MSWKLIFQQSKTIWLVFCKNKIYIRRLEFSYKIFFRSLRVKIKLFTSFQSWSKIHSFLWDIIITVHELIMSGDYKHDMTLSKKLYK